MPSALFVRSRRLVTTASMLTVLTAIAHSLGHFAPASVGAGAKYAYYQIPPPLISTALIELAMLSWLLLPARREA